MFRAFAGVCLALPFAFGSVADADAETRTLKLYFIHTGERAEITFKKDGKYIPSGLNKLNRFLRDWRRNEPTRMDPQLFDIVWEAYQMAGAKDYINVVSGYRSPATNEMLRRTRGGQAKKSQHMLGKAMDFFIPGVKLSKLREIGFKLQGGGVGYYPKSGSPFVHLDTGSVRAWPRMSRAELTRVFPKGGTLHLPADGKPLPGYQQALAAYKARKAKGQATAIAYAGNSTSRNSGGGLLAGVFGGGSDEEEDNVEAVAPTPRPTAIIRNEPAKTPGTLVASLAPQNIPLPQLAPRAQPVAIASAMDAPRPLVSGEATKPLVPGLPVPAPRPPALLASAEPAPPRRSATEIEAALSAAAAAPVPQRETVSAVIAAAERIEPPTIRGLRVPIPTPRPGAETLVASIAPDVIPARPTAYAPPEPEPRPLAQQEKSYEVAALPEPQPIAPDYDTGVTTTSRSARPAAETMVDNDLIPAEWIEPARYGSWVTAGVSIVDYGRMEPLPVFMQNAERAAPTEVYTDGFQHVPAPDPRRFSGQAVNFLEVTSFADAGDGGDGMPLMLQIPMPN